MLSQIRKTPVTRASLGIRNKVLVTLYGIIMYASSVLLTQTQCALFTLTTQMNQAIYTGQLHKASLEKCTLSRISLQNGGQNYNL